MGGYWFSLVRASVAPKCREQKWRRCRHTNTEPGADRGKLQPAWGGSSHRVWLITNLLTSAAVVCVVT
jgi:hypothetical protein